MRTSQRYGRGAGSGLGRIGEGGLSACAACGAAVVAAAVANPMAIL